MIFTSSLDVYFVSLALYAYQVIWGIIVGSGIIYVPFIIVIIGTLRDIAESSKNFADSGFMMKRLEAKIYPMVLAIPLVIAPIAPLDLAGSTQYSKVCKIDSSINVVDRTTAEANKETVESDRLASGIQLPARGVLMEMAGESLQIPFLLKIVMSLGTGASVGAVDKLPCGVNLSAVSDTFSSTKIPDNALKVELKEFMSQCYEPAKKKAYKDKDVGMVWIENSHSEEQPWPGYGGFLNSTYYGNVGEDFYSKSLIPGFQAAKTNKNIPKWIESQKAEQNGSIDCSSGNCLHQLGGFPSCYEWWSGIGAGYSGVSISNEDVSLKKRLKDNLKSNNTELLASAISRFYPSMGLSELDENVFRMSYFNQDVMQQISNAETTDYAMDDSQNTAMAYLSRALGTIGTVGSAISQFAGASMIQMAAPIGKGLALMVVICMLPLAYVVAKMEWKFIIAVHFFIASILLWPFLWELAILAQQSFIEEVMENGQLGVLDFVNNPNMKLISLYLTDALFLIFPTLLTGLLTSAGMTVGTQLQSLSGMESRAGSPANSAGSAMQKKTINAASKGVNAAKTVASGPAGLPPKK